MEKNYCVYKHTAPNGKVYIGITSQMPEARWGKDGSGYKHNKHFWNAICKYGWNAFVHEILLEGLTADQAGEFERLFIDLYDSWNPKKGYNNTSGGERGFQRSKATLAKMSQATKTMWQDKDYRDSQINVRNSEDFRNKQAENSKKQWADDEVRKKMILALCKNWEDEEFRKRQLEILHNPERLQKISDSMKKKWTTDEHREKVQSTLKKHWSNPNERKKQSERLKAFWQKPGYRENHSGGNSPLSKEILQFDKHGNLLNKYASLKDAEKSLNIPKAACHISACANGKRKSAYGYIWKYE